MRMGQLIAAVGFVLLGASSSYAQAPSVRELQRAQMEQLRGQIASQIQLQAYDLLDELVYAWTQKPPFPVETPVVLADVTSPVGFGSGLDALIENHFAALVTNNRKGNVQLAHCPQCTSIVVQAGAKGTVVSRGVDNPEALEKLGGLSGSKHALFLDFEAEGSSLVLRARITELQPALPIVYARTLTTSTSSPALLRTPERLKSATEARQEYMDALEKRGLFLVPLKVGVRMYAEPEEGSSPVATAPYVWLQIGAEAALTQARAWTASAHLGGTWTPQVHTGWLAGARISRLLTGSTVSLTRPDLYGFAGLNVISIHGQGARTFKQGQLPNMVDIVNNAGRADFHSTFAALQLGAELRVKNRIGVSFYLENLPGLGNAQGIGDYLDFGFVQFQSLGAEVSFCF